MDKKVPKATSQQSIREEEERDSHNNFNDDEQQSKAGSNYLIPSDIEIDQVCPQR
jgi:hypothetical protein